MILASAFFAGRDDGTVFPVTFSKIHLGRRPPVPSDLKSFFKRSPTFPQKRLLLLNGLKKQVLALVILSQVASPQPLSFFPDRSQSVIRGQTYPSQSPCHARLVYNP